MEKIKKKINALSADNIRTLIREMNKNGITKEAVISIMNESGRVILIYEETWKVEEE